MLDKKVKLMKSDARVRYTKMRIRDAFLTCLRQKPVNKITVKELCDMAEINRATFYSHYKDPFDLLEQLEREELDKMAALLDQSMEKGSNILLTILKGLQEPGSVNSVLASSNADPAYTARISELFYKRYRSRVAEKMPGIPQEKQEEVYRFIAGGSGNLLKYWREDGMKVPAEEMAGRINALTDGVIRTIVNK